MMRSTLNACLISNFRKQQQQHRRRRRLRPTVEEESPAPSTPTTSTSPPTSVAWTLARYRVQFNYSAACSTGQLLTGSFIFSCNTFDHWYFWHLNFSLPLDMPIHRGERHRGGGKGPCRPGPSRRRREGQKHDPRQAR